MDVFSVTTRGLPQLAKFVGELPDRVARNAVHAVNKGADSTRTSIDAQIRSKLNFKASYLAPSAKRLYVKSYATSGVMEAVVSGRDRPTSLARFGVGLPAPWKKGGVTVMVKRGVTKQLPRALVVTLKSGASQDAPDFNLGIAIRLKPGETLTDKRQTVAMRNGLTLLYGPSVGQVMRQYLKGDSAVLREAADTTEAEFDRLMERV